MGALAGYLVLVLRRRLRILGLFVSVGVVCVKDFMRLESFGVNSDSYLCHFSAESVCYLKISIGSNYYNSSTYCPIRMITTIQYLYDYFLAL